MKVIREIKELKAAVEGFKSENQTVGFVPTMGALHDGHLSLVRASQEKSDITIVSIYVNPSQFNVTSDFENYPKNEAADIALLLTVKCDIVFIPSVAEVESLPLPTNVDIGELANVMEGKERPGHFEGVIEVVYRLFKAVNPDYSFFGEKDFQQVMVVEKMVLDTGINVEIIGCPIIRENTGLAMSSRNVRLSENARIKSAKIYEILKSEIFQNIEEKSNQLTQEGFEVEYIEKHELGNSSRLFTAVWLEGVRLIDNIALV